jgi:hypothetical protein
LRRGGATLPVFSMNSIVKNGCIAAGTEAEKITALVNAVVDATLDAISKKSAVSGAQKASATALKADLLLNVDQLRAALYGA